MQRRRRVVINLYGRKAFTGIDAADRRTHWSAFDAQQRGHILFLQNSGAERNPIVLVIKRIKLQYLIRQLILELKIRIAFKLVVHIADFDVTLLTEKVQFKLSSGRNVETSPATMTAIEPSSRWIRNAPFGSSPSVTPFITSPSDSARTRLPRK